MRYYVLKHSVEPGRRPYITAQAVAPDDEGSGSREDAVDAGSNGSLHTKQELMAFAAGRRALSDWEAGDDSSFEQEIRRTVGSAEGRPERIDALTRNEFAGWPIEHGASLEGAKEAADEREIRKPRRLRVVE